ncbi:MAG: Rha family transcriptional regulator [Enterobacteriaceae bacterium]
MTTSTNQISLIAGSAPHMSTREIAELTGKKHAHVVRDVENMLNQLGLISPNLDNDDYKGFIVNKRTYNGRIIVDSISLDQDLTMTLVMGYSIPLRHKVAKRWRELEQSTALALPDFTNPAAAARAWADEVEQKLLIAQERDQAIRTKAEIGSRREATAMATASVAVRERNKLAERLGQGIKHATITAIQNSTGIKYPWRPLKDWCNANDVEAVHVNCDRYGKVRSWPYEAWKHVYNIDLRKALAGGDHA